MAQLPVIVGFGGINPAGRASFHHAYRRLILDKLSSTQRAETIISLGALMGLVRHEDGHYLNTLGDVVSEQALAAEIEQQVRNNTLIRRIQPDCFDVNHVPFNRPATINTPEGDVRFQLRKRQMPQQIPSNWQVSEPSPGLFDITVSGALDVIFPDSKEAPVQSAGQLPTGFQPGKLYQSRNHPRNLQMTVYGASDALFSSGIAFEQIADRLRPDQIAVYASNSIGQLDDYGFGGLTKFPTLGKRTTSKQMPLGYAQMPADFINAYLLGSVGTTGGALGACATFLYNLRSGVDDIRSGRRKAVLVGGSDAPVIPEVIEGFRAMGALAEDKDLRTLDSIAELTEEHYRRACRPFGDNCGFTIGESSQFVLLMADDLAVEMGAQIFGSVPEVFVNADGHKKSISAPGVGNYITLGKAAALVENMLGTDSLRHRSFVQAHGTSTPQNRVTESHVINEIAKAYGIQDWTVSAVKAYLGHSQGTAGGDQLTTSLGVWAHGIIPGLTTTSQIAADVYQSNLHFPLQHLEVGTGAIDSVLLNSKGFGGNNASAPVLSPSITEQLLTRRHGEQTMTAFKDKQQKIQANAADYEQQALRGQARPIYRYDHNVLAGEDLSISHGKIEFPGYAQPVDLNVNNPFEDMC